MVEDTLGSFSVVSRLLKEAAEIVHNITNCTKPVISAINGTAVGAGLAVALTADISIAAENARLTDGHLKLGVAAGRSRGDHLAAALRHGEGPLLPADQRLHRRPGGRAHRPGQQVHARRRADADRAADRRGPGRRPAWAIAATKRTLNHWVRAATPIFESALALEMLGFFSEDAREGLNAMREKRRPKFPSSLGTES